MHCEEWSCQKRVNASNIGIKALAKTKYACIVNVDADISPGKSYFARVACKLTVHRVMGHHVRGGDRREVRRRRTRDDCDGGSQAVKQSNQMTLSAR